MSESIQHKLSRVRPPRVHITYDVEIGDAIIMKELPFVMGILADLSGQSEQPLPKLKDRKFVFIDRDNFNDVLKSTAPRVAIRVKDALAEDENAFTNVDLHFNALEDFEPLRIIHQIPSLNALYASRIRLNDLLAALEGNDALEEQLTQILTDEEVRNILKAEINQPAVDPLHETKKEVEK